MYPGGAGIITAAVQILTRPLHLSLEQQASAINTAWPRTPGMQSTSHLLG